VKTILSIIVGIVTWLFKLRDSLGRNKDISNDQELADAIRRGDGRKIAEEWKRRKYYSKEKK
jgi:hypothetical protein